MIASDAVYEALESDVRAWFRRRSPPDAVDDLVQDAFVRIHAGLSGLRDSERVAPWVFRICRSVLIDRARRLQPTEVLDSEPAAPEPEGSEATAMVASWLPAFVDALPEPYREAVRLSELEGLSQAEVARRLGLSASGARTRVQRGRKLVRERLDACCRVTLEAGEVVDVRRTGDCGCASS